MLMRVKLAMRPGLGSSKYSAIDGIRGDHPSALGAFLRFATLITQATGYIYRYQLSDPSNHVTRDKQRAASIRQ
jgi:hypothetical protein